MRPKLKLNNISSLHDARYCSAVGVEIIAFNLLPDAGDAFTSDPTAEIPDPIYTMLTKEGLKPVAFSLGDFVEEPDGHLDYETCDDFIEEFQSLAL